MSEQKPGAKAICPRCGCQRVIQAEGMCRACLDPAPVGTTTGAQSKTDHRHLLSAETRERLAILNSGGKLPPVEVADDRHHDMSGSVPTNPYREGAKPLPLWALSLDESVDRRGLPVALASELERRERPDFPMIRREDFRVVPETTYGGPPVPYITSKRRERKP